MTPYKILPQQRAAAKKLGVTIRPSTVKGKKIDVYKGAVKVASIGARGYGDYWNYFRNNTPYFVYANYHYYWCKQRYYMAVWQILIQFMVIMMLLKHQKKLFYQDQKNKKFTLML